MTKSLLGPAAIAAVMLTMIFAPAAPAQVGFVGENCTITQDAYGPGLCEPDPPSDPPEGNGKRLPFTGADMGIVGLLGAMLLGGGVAMRRATTRDRS